MHDPMTQSPAELSMPSAEIRLKIEQAEPDKLNAAFAELLSSPEIPDSHKLVLAADCFRRFGALDGAQRAAAARAAADSGLDPFCNFPYLSLPDPEQAQDPRRKSQKGPFEASLAYWAGFNFSPSEYDALLGGRYRETYCNGVFPNIAAAVTAKNRDMVRHLFSLGAELEFDEPGRSGEPGRKAHAIELATEHYEPGIFEDFIDHCSTSILTRKYRHGQSILNYLAAKDCHGSFQIVQKRLSREDLLSLLGYEHDIYKQKTIHYALKTIDRGDIGTEKIVMELLDVYGEDIWPKDPGEAACLAHVAVQQLSVPSIKKALAPERINAVSPKNRQALFYVLSQDNAEEKIQFLLDMGQDPFRNAGDSRWDYDWNPFEQMVDNSAYIRPRTYCHILLSHPGVDPFIPRRIHDETVGLAEFVEKRHPDMSDYFEDWKLMVQSRKESQELAKLPLPQNAAPKKPGL